MTFDLAAATVFVTVAGSVGNGTARAGSDLDLRGVCIAPLATRLSLGPPFEQHEGAVAAGLRPVLDAALRAHPAAAPFIDGKLESVTFEVAKFVRLCVGANPNALEILFADPRDWLWHTAAWDRIYAARRLFLTQAVRQTFLGYAKAQLAKIRSHRGWLLHPPAAPPTRSAYGLPEASVLPADDRHRVEEALATLAPETSTRTAAAAALGLSAEVLAALDGERRYRAAQKQWDAFVAWQRGRNPGRAELERRYGYDTKHAMHLVRLLRCGLEVIRDGELRVSRPDAEELRAIRDGAWSYDHLIAEATALEAATDAAAATCALPTTVDLTAVDALLFELVT